MAFTASYLATACTVEESKCSSGCALGSNLSSSIYQLCHCRQIIQPLRALDFLLAKSRFLPMELAQCLVRALCCPCRGLRFSSQHSYGGSQPSVTLYPDIRHPLLAFVDIRHAHGPHIYMQEKHTHTFKKCF